ncbi:MAG: SGNH/GDSL hydrolase family protein [Spirochaetes bacterium]|nr:SGNH/GDSL hydrolase family protein [Spirochaetota bacterium]
MEKHSFVKEDFYLITNADEIIRDRDGIVPCRLRSAAFSSLPKDLAVRAKEANGMELCFETNARTLAVTLEVLNPAVRDDGSLSFMELSAGDLTVCGFHPVYFRKGMQRIVFTIAPHAQEGVYRLSLPHGMVIRLVTIETDDSAYLKKSLDYMMDLSAKPVWIAYGPPEAVSMTMPSASWTKLVSHAVDILPVTMDFGGAVIFDEQFTQYLAARADWSLFSFLLDEAAVASYAGDTKRFHADYTRIIGTLRKTHPDHPILCISPLWSSSDAAAAVRGDAAPLAPYRDAIRNVMKNRLLEDHNLYFLEGTTVIEHNHGLCDDYLTLNGYGHVRMANAVSAVFKEAMKKKK